jgi:hypothetical protein
MSRGDSADGNVLVNLCAFKQVKPHVSSLLVAQDEKCSTLFLRSILPRSNRFRKKIEMTIEAVTGSEFLHVVISLSVLLYAAKIFAELFARIKLPVILGELVAGIIVGPFAFCGRSRKK